MQFKNISKFGDLDLPLIGRVVEAGEIFDVTPDQSELLILQPDLWQPIQPDNLAALTVPDLKALATQRGIDTTGLKVKADYVAALQPDPEKPASTPGTADTKPADQQETRA
jgi:hypothetical protein